MAACKNMTLKKLQKKKKRWVKQDREKKGVEKIQ